MPYGLRITTEPAEEPITTAEAKVHLLIASAVTAHDSYIGNLITAARKYVEDMLNRSLVTTEWELTLDTFPYHAIDMRIPRSPLVTIDSVSYVDSAGATQAWNSSNYVVNVGMEPARLSLAYSQSWPSARFQPNAVTIAFTAGYGDAGDVPMPIKQAILLLIGHWFEHRSEVETGIHQKMPMAAEALLNAYRVGDEFVSYSEC